MSKRFSPPPNWPTPPQGWIPPEGWKPDPAWGPPPPGWQIWIDEPGPAVGGPWAMEPAFSGGSQVTYQPTKRSRAVWIVPVVIAIALLGGCAVLMTSVVSNSRQSNVEKAGPVSQAQVDAAPEISERDLALLVKDPDSHTGKTIILYARITQFDAATGVCAFRANISFKKMDNAWEYGANSLFSGRDQASKCPELSSFVADDEVRITATSIGSISYDTQIGGRTTVPKFRVENISAVK